jgi:hypothetical protein
MNAETLRQALHARPFRPFILYMADGEKLPVIHPDYIAISPTGRTAHVFAKGGDAAELVDLLLVTRIGYRSTPRKRKRA